MCYFLKSCRDYCSSWSESWMCLVEISNSTYSWELWIIINHKSPTILYEDNAACITQIRGGYIKGDKNKHIALNFFYTYKHQKSGDIDVKQIRSCDNLANMFTKPLPTANFKKMVHNIGMHQLKDIFTTNNGNSMYSWGGVNFLKNVCLLIVFFFLR